MKWLFGICFLPIICSAQLDSATLKNYVNFTPVEILQFKIDSLEGVHLSLGKEINVAKSILDTANNYTWVIANNKLDSLKTSKQQIENKISLLQSQSEGLPGGRPQWDPASISRSVTIAEREKNSKVAGALRNAGYVWYASLAIGIVGGLVISTASSSNQVKVGAGICFAGGLVMLFVPYQLICAGDNLK